MKTTSLTPFLPHPTATGSSTQFQNADRQNDSPLVRLVFCGQDFFKTHISIHLDPVTSARLSQTCKHMRNIYVLSEIESHEQEIQAIMRDIPEACHR